jgi:amino acid transporter
MTEPAPRSSTDAAQVPMRDPFVRVPAGSLLRRRGWRTWLIGKPLSTADAPHQTVSKRVGLAVFASDALSSTAYATQEILHILAVAGIAAFAFATPIAAAIVVLLAIVTISYRQTIMAYPGGGGAYIVARDNLGDRVAQVAGAALLTDYVLTVAVSVSAGVQQVYSAFPVLYEHRVVLAAAFIGLITIVNLRGVRESGAAFSVPTYFFLFAMMSTVALGVARMLSGDLGSVTNPPELAHAAAAPVTLFLLLHAFSSGTTALTGIEAISNGVPVFREPKSKNAARTLTVMACLLATMFIGITVLAVDIGAVPSEFETVVSQIGRTVYGGQNALYFALMAATTVILIMAANTAYADFPRLAAIVAADGYLPRQLTYRGSRLVFSRGIVMLALVAFGLVAVFKASVTSLIPLYAIGVFLSFTLSQLAMARRWQKIGTLPPGDTRREAGSTLEHDPGWRTKMAVNLVGGMLTLIVLGVFTVTKFRDGAWMVICLIPVLVFLFFRVNKHYRSLAARLSLERYGSPPRMTRHRVIIAVSGVHRGTVAGLDYGRALSSDVTAVHVSIDPLDADRVREKWSLWGDGVRLVILESPYRLLVEPMLEYVEEIARLRRPNEVITVVVPHFVPAHGWENVLHTQTAYVLALALRDIPGVVVTAVPYKVSDEDPDARGTRSVQ